LALRMFGAGCALSATAVRSGLLLFISSLPGTLGPSSWLQSRPAGSANIQQQYHSVNGGAAYAISHGQPVSPCLPFSQRIGSSRLNDFRETVRRAAVRLERVASLFLQKLPLFFKRMRQWALDAARRLRDYLVPLARDLWQVFCAFLPLAAWYSPIAAAVLVVWVEPSSLGAWLFLGLAVLWCIGITLVVKFWEPKVNEKKQPLLSRGCKEETDPESSSIQEETPPEGGQSS